MSQTNAITSIFQEMFDTLKAKQRWQCQLMFNTTQSVDDEPHYVNLSEVLKSNNNFPFPDHFDGIENKTKLITALRISSMKSGFWIVVRSSKSGNHLNKHHSAYLNIKCQHSIIYRKRSSNNIRKCKTRYSTSAEDVCRFVMNISLCSITNKWYLHHTKGKKRLHADMHNNHLQLDASEMHSHISLFPENELELVSQCSQININYSRTAALLNVRNILGIVNHWTRYQVRYLHDKNNEFSALNNESSSAEQLIEALSSREDCNFLYVTFNPNEGLMFLTGKVDLLFQHNQLLNNLLITF